MTSYDRGDLVLATLPFSDLTGMKKRSAVVVSAPHPSADLFLLPLTSQLENLQPGEFSLVEWKGAGLLFPSVVKRGLFTLDKACINRRFGCLAVADQRKLDSTLRLWLGL
jgi:mRNA interferase MazF